MRSTYSSGRGSQLFNLEGGEGEIEASKSQRVMNPVPRQEFKHTLEQLNHMNKKIEEVCDLIKAQPNWQGQQQNYIFQKKVEETKEEDEVPIDAYVNNRRQDQKQLSNAELYVRFRGFNSENG